MNILYIIEKVVFLALHTLKTLKLEDNFLYIMLDLVIKDVSIHGFNLQFPLRVVWKRHRLGGKIKK